MSTLKAINLVHPTSATNNIVLDSTGNAAVGGTMAMSSSFMRNRIINGAMVVDQRNVGASQTYTAAAAIAYNVDRFYGSCTGANVTGQRTTGPSGFQNCYQFTGAASVTAILFGQRIESYNCADFVSQSVTLSANISNSLLTTVTWTAYYANSADSFATKTQIATGTFTVSSTAATYQATFNAGANAANGIAIELSVGAQTSGTWKITGVQLEVGTVATPFERRLLPQEIQFCQRFYQKSYAIEVALGTSTTGGYASNPGHAGGTGNSRANIRFATEMRAAPTLAYWDLVGNANRSSTFFGNNSQSDNISSASFNLTGIGTSGFAFNNAGGAGSAGAGAWASACHWTASAEL
jgi:hypothetical protein